MSFTLFVFDADTLPDPGEGLDELTEERSGAALTPRLAALRDGLIADFAALDTDPDNSPWSSWPLDAQLTAGPGVGFDISWRWASTMLLEFRKRCADLSLSLYDPHDGILYQPGR